MDLLINIMENLVENHTYLLKYKYDESLYSATILLITAKAYHIRWNNGLTTSQTWLDKENFHSKYRLVEDISDFLVEKLDCEQLNNNNWKVNTMWESCPICNGFGTLPETNTTVGSRICSLCNGNKLIPKITQIEKK